MTVLAKRTFNLPAEQAAFIESQVENGSYSSASEVVGAGLLALQDREASIEQWLRDEVIPTYDRWAANPSDTLSSERVAEQMRQHHEAYLNGPA